SSARHVVPSSPLRDALPIYCRHHAQDGTPYGAVPESGPPRGDAAASQLRSEPTNAREDESRLRGDAADEAAGSRAHAMERALARAAASAGIRNRLLDAY